MNIRRPLHPIPQPSGGFYLPATSATMSNIEKGIFCRVLKSLRPPDGYLGTLKKYVRNRAHPEGSIAKGYLMEECMNFCSRYLNNVEIKANRQPRNCEGDDDMGRGLYKGNRFIIDRVTLLKIHRYVLENSDIVSPYHEKHKFLIRRENPRSTPMEIQRIHSETFHDWFRSHVQSLKVSSDPELSIELIALANGPIEHVKSYNACIVRGYRYRVKTFDAGKKTQCSGVVVHADTLSFASSKDLRPRSGKVSYYGILTNIIEVEYTRDMKFLMFQCDWVDNEKGVKEDEFKFTLANFNSLTYGQNLPTDEPFVLASQVVQIWYIPDPVEPDWNVVVPMSRRDNYDVYSTVEVEPHSSKELDDSISNSNEDFYWVRDGIEGVFVDEAYATIDGVET